MPFLVSPRSEKTLTRLKELMDVKCSRASSSLGKRLCLCWDELSSRYSADDICSKVSFSALLSSLFWIGKHIAPYKVKTYLVKRAFHFNKSLLFS